MDAFDNTRRKSFLSLTPVHFSLTAGTSIPAPPDSPPESPSSLGRPPTPGRGPLASHPVDPMDMPGAFPPTPEPEKEASHTTKLSTSTTDMAPPPRKDSFSTPISPVSGAELSSPQTRKPSGVRRLMSLASLRSSFSSSRTSLSLPRPSTQSDTRPFQQGQKRPSSPTTSTSTNGTSFQPRPQLRQKKSSGWFRRKSGMFLLNQNDEVLDPVDEAQRPETQHSKRSKLSKPKASEEVDVREFAPPPMLPEVGTLRGGRLTGGQVGWEESMFTR